MTQKIIAGSKYDRKMSGTVLRKDIQVGFERKLFVKFGVIVGFLTLPSSTLAAQQRKLFGGETVALQRDDK